MPYSGVLFKYNSSNSYLNKFRPVQNTTLFLKNEILETLRKQKVLIEKHSTKSQHYNPTKLHYYHPIAMDWHDWQWAYEHTA